MTATERIKQIENNSGRMHDSETQFLLAAFNEMRKIAARLHQDLHVKMEDDNLIVPLWMYTTEQIDKLFDQKMKGFL